MTPSPGGESGVSRSTASGRSRGLAWPIAGLDFAPDRRIGTSNRAEGAVELSFDAPGMLTILPAAVLPAAIAALRASEAW